jgi:hypothetical protein
LAGRVDDARQHGVHPHAVLAVLGVEGIDEGEHRRLADDVAGGARRTAAAPRARRRTRSIRRRPSSIAGSAARHAR